MNTVKSPKKLIKLEAVRGFAAVYVVFHHAFSKGFVVFGRDFSVLFRFGQEAVILFFVLSGFVINYAYQRSKDKSFKIFFLKRFLRIYIPLLSIFILNYILIVIPNKGWVGIDWYTLTGNLLMLQDVSGLKPNVIVGPFLGNLPLWSLSYEFWFYIIFFVVINNVKRNASFFVYALGTLSAVTYLFYPNFVNRELMYLIIWWVGADMSNLYLNKHEINFETLKIPLLVLFVNIIILGINVKMNNHHSTIGESPFLELRHFSFAFVSVILLIVWKKLKWFGFSLVTLIFEPIASISFGLYISHWFLVIQAHYLDNIISNVFIRFGSYLLICMLVSYIIERIIYLKLSKWVMLKISKTDK